MDICGPNNKNNAQGNFFVLISLTNTSRNNKVWTTITPSELASMKNHKSPTCSVLHKESKWALEELSNWEIACRFLHLPGASYLFHTSSQSPKTSHKNPVAVRPSFSFSFGYSSKICDRVESSSLPSWLPTYVRSWHHGVAFFQGDYIYTPLY